MKKVRVYQLPTEHNAKFMGLEFVTEHNIMPRLEEYNLVWEGEVEEDANLDALYTKFNVGQKPEDYKGHSLSMSDLVEMDGKFYYCDEYGWEEVFSQPKDNKNKKYIVIAYGSTSYISIHDTKEEADAKAEQLNSEYYQHKVWNVEEVAVEDEDTDEVVEDEEPKRYMLVCSDMELLKCVAKALINNDISFGFSANGEIPYIECSSKEDLEEFAYDFTCDCDASAAYQVVQLPTQKEIDLEENGNRCAGGKKMA